MTAPQVIVFTLQASILLTVFGFGLQATAADVLSILKQRWLLTRSLVAMFVVMPIVAVTLVVAFELRPPVEAVLLALAISPVPPLLPGRQRSRHQAGAEGSYGLGLMVIAGLIAIVLVPLTLGLIGRYLGRPFTMPRLDIARVVLVAAVLPLAAGLFVRAAMPRVAGRVAKPAGRVAQVLLIVGLAGLLAGTLPQAMRLVGNGTLAAMVAFMAAGLAAGHGLGGPAAGDRLVLALSTSTRHPAIAFAIAKANFPDEPNLGAAVVLYLLVSLGIGLPYQAWQNARAGPVP